MIRTLRFFSVCTLSILLTATLNARPVHDFHTTFMVIEHNQERKSLEITLKMFTHDLVPTLEKLLSRRVDLGSTEGLDKAIFQYISDRFTISTNAGVRLEAEWVGKEVDAQDVYCYLEIPFDGPLEPAAIQNTLFFERFDEQVNYVTLKYLSKKADLVFKVGDKAKVAEFTY